MEVNRETSLAPSIARTFVSSLNAAFNAARSVLPPPFGPGTGHRPSVAELQDEPPSIRDET
jgi:hypothetical protein